MARLGVGVRNRPRIAQDTCADCGTLDPGWASINRGILICDECCSVHRSLGRHISQVKSLRKGSWHPLQLATVHELNGCGANHVWEHTLLDPSNMKAMRRKPQPKDPVHPNKADFIRAKHQMMSFVYRQCKEDSPSADKDISRQLHASVRTRNLEISLRLLSQGADPNYCHTEKGNSPIHVAARAGQESQVELLVIYGADPGAPDKEGKTPVEYAKEGGFHTIADRLVELQYELTDHLAFYLCGRKPDHSGGQHWVIPEMADAVEGSEVAKEARAKLVALPNHSFEELACDVYDEVDRRETDAIWLSMQNQSALLSDRCSVPFLPVNPEFSSTRNQGRQKLARFSAREFATLIIDILIEARRRMCGFTPPVSLSAKAVDIENPDPSNISHSSFSSSYAIPFSGDWSSSNLADSGASYKDQWCVGGAVGRHSNEGSYASYDEVYVSSEEEEKRDKDGDSVERSDSESGDGSSDGNVDEECFEKCSSHSEERLGEGCVSDLLSGRWSPILSRRSQKKKQDLKKKNKKSKKQFKSSSGVSSDSDDIWGLSPTSRSSASTNFSVQVAKLLNSKASWAFGDIHPRKLNIVHHPLRCETLPACLQAPYMPSSNKSRFVRTLTLPLKFASQKHQTLSGVLSRSQPTSPELIRKFSAPPQQFSRSEPSRQMVRHSLSTKQHNCNRCLSVQGEYLVTKPPAKGSRRLFHHSFSSGASCSVMRSDPPFLPPYLSTSPTQVVDNPVLEPCPTCAYNVAVNIQHPSIWGDATNLPKGYKMPEDKNAASRIRTKSQKDDCKLQ